MLLLLLLGKFFQRGVKRLKDVGVEEGLAQIIDLQLETIQVTVEPFLEDFLNACYGSDAPGA